METEEEINNMLLSNQRRHSLTTLVKKSNNANISRRRSLDFDGVADITELSRRQRRKLNRRLSKVTSMENRIEEIKHHSGGDSTPISNPYKLISNEDDDIIFVRPMDKNNEIKTGNMFSVLNSSLHDDPTPIKQRSLNYQKMTNGTSSTPIKNHHPSGSSSSHDESTSIPTSTSLIKGGISATRRKHLRSKSTSPARKTEVEKLRKNYENFNPDNVKWT